MLFVSLQGDDIDKRQEPGAAVVERTRSPGKGSILGILMSTAEVSPEMLKRITRGVHLIFSQTNLSSVIK